MKTFLIYTAVLAILFKTGNLVFRTTEDIATEKAEEAVKRMPTPTPAPTPKPRYVSPLDYKPSK